MNLNFESEKKKWREKQRQTFNFSVISHYFCDFETFFKNSLNLIKFLESYYFFMIRAYLKLVCKWFNCPIEKKNPQQQHFIQISFVVGSKTAVPIFQLIERYFSYWIWMAREYCQHLYVSLWFWLKLWFWFLVLLIWLVLILIDGFGYL